jgi:hypothetical protein
MDVLVTFRHSDKIPEKIILEKRYILAHSCRGFSSRPAPLPLVYSKAEHHGGGRVCWSKAAHLMSVGSREEGMLRTRHIPQRHAPVTDF